MAIYFGNDKIKEIYVGSDKIKEVYYGSEKVWGAIEAIQGYWVHKDTGVITYFDADADFITDGIMNAPSWADDCSEVQLPTGVTGLGDYCFWDSSSLTSITLPEGVTSIGSACFSGCISLTSINISEGVTSIGGYCFLDCISLTSITLPESVTSIGSQCFRYCSSLTSINIPESVTSIQSYSFRNCSSLTLATVLPATPPTLGSNVFRDVHPSFNIKVRSPYVDAYKTATNWNAYANKISAI
jgi:hypothetical protein